MESNGTLSVFLWLSQWVCKTSTQIHPENPGVDKSLHLYRNLCIFTEIYREIFCIFVYSISNTLRKLLCRKCTYKLPFSEKGGMLMYAVRFVSRSKTPLFRVSFRSLVLPLHSFDTKLKNPDGVIPAKVFIMLWPLYSLHVARWAAGDIGRFTAWISPCNQLQLWSQVLGNFLTTWAGFCELIPWKAKLTKHVL